MPAVTQARDRLLARVATLRERDVGLVEARLGREDRLRPAPSPSRGRRPRSGRARAPRSQQCLAPLSPVPRPRPGSRRADPRPRRRRPSRRAPRARSRTSRRTGTGAASPGRPRPARARSATGSPPAPRRHTRSGAISRPFGVSSSAGRVAGGTSFESIRWRSPPHPGPRPGRRNEAGPLRGPKRSHPRSLGSAPVPVEGRGEVRRGRLDPARLPPGAVPDREMARAPRRLGAGGRPRRRGGSLFGRGREAVTLTGSSCSSCRPARSPSTSTASPAGAASTRRSRASTGASSRSSPGRGRPAASWSRTPSRVSRRTCRSRRSRTSSRLSPTQADGEPLTPDHGWPLRLMVPSRTSGRAPSGSADRAPRPRPARLLGALRLPQRRRPLEGGALQF